MASLLDRMNITSTGPVRGNSNRTSRASPYSRPPKGDVESTWAHDLYEPHNSLSARIHSSSSHSESAVLPLARALSSIKPQTLSIRGASSSTNFAGNVVEVTGLASGTTPEDVSVIFKRCGPILQKDFSAKSTEETPIIRLTYKDHTHAKDAVAKFHGQTADGKVLGVRIVGGTSVALAGRLAGTAAEVVGDEGSVDALMTGDDDASGGSKMRSDRMITDPRASVMLAPPGADVKDYIPAQPQNQGRRGGRGGGRARGGRGARKSRLGERMEIDRRVL